MNRTLVVCLLFAVGCAKSEGPVVDVPPMPEDLSAWTAPEVVDEPDPLVPPIPLAPRPKPANTTIFRYEPGKTYHVPVALGTSADIALEPGEIVHNIVGGDRAPLQEGDTPRWEMKEGQSETQHIPIAHVFFTPTHAGQKMGVVITTDRRTYYLTLMSVEHTTVRGVQWTYQTPPPTQVAVKRPTLVPDGSHSQRYHVGYTLGSAGPLPDWAPTQVVDDGRKTYLVFPATMLYQSAPLVRLIGPQGPQLVNSRQVGRVYVVDQLIAQLELRVGAGEHAQVMTVTRGALETITCPGQKHCPAWAEMTGRAY